MISSYPKSIGIPRVDGLSTRPPGFEASQLVSKLRLYNGPHSNTECQLGNPCGQMSVEQAQYLSRFPQPQ